jgi:hypothetical protein
MEEDIERNTSPLSCEYTVAAYIQIQAMTTFVLKICLRTREEKFFGLKMYSQKINDIPVFVCSESLGNVRAGSGSHYLEETHCIARS